jgi:hypothetical protein
MSENKDMVAVGDNFLVEKMDFKTEPSVLTLKESLDRRWNIKIYDKNNTLLPESGVYDEHELIATLKKIHFSGKVVKYIVELK